VQVLAAAPWLLTPAIGIFAVALALHLMSGTDAESGIVAGAPAASPSRPLTAARTAR
jgi:hypothetical protein